ncbi:AraC family transcriptional regulator [Enterobacter cloacae]|uniref:AraC family transcriptional regulator n=1 Tax=Enterobacter cloacae TaxID=550 RepID=UPI000B8D6F10|nr:AraC family transcriptional regulator [Enterobacter cloacae]ASQ15702.1 Virulence regulon transcriptional activator VirF [Enterobacter cloacae]
MGIISFIKRNNTNTISLFFVLDLMFKKTSGIKNTLNLTRALTKNRKGAILFSNFLSDRISIQHKTSEPHITFKNVRFHYCSLVYVNSGTVIFKNGNGDEFCFEGEQVLFIEKNITLNITEKNKKSLKCYMVYNIKNDELCTLYAMLKTYSNCREIPFLTTRDIFHFQADSIDQSLFRKLNDDTCKHEKCAIMLYMLSKFGKIPGLYTSIARSIKFSFSETVRDLLENDISRNWTMDMVAEDLNISKSNVRRKLFSEGLKFNELLLDIRMRKALRLILTTDLHINTIAYNLGFSNVSYFISLFKKHYGYTPKKLSVQIKNTSSFKD